MIESVIKRSSRESRIIIISPYHNWKGLRRVISIVKKALGMKEAKVYVNLLTCFPPDFESKYSTDEAFTELDEFWMKDERIN